MTNPMPRVWLYHWCPYHGYQLYFLHDNTLPKPPLEDRCLKCMIDEGRLEP